jgi:hypothetical protein
MQQQMTIKASNGTMSYRAVNALRGKMTPTTVTSKRAGIDMTKTGHDDYNDGPMSSVVIFRARHMMLTMGLIVTSLVTRAPRPIS